MFVTLYIGSYDILKITTLNVLQTRCFAYFPSQLYLKANKISKSEQVKKVEYAYNFYRAMRCISAVFAVTQCLSVRLSVRPSVRHVRGSRQNE